MSQNKYTFGTQTLESESPTSQTKSRQQASFSPKNTRLKKRKKNTPEFILRGTSQLAKKRVSKT